MRKFNFSYDKENDDLLLFNPKSKSKGSVELGNIILDYGKNREFVGMQIMNASNTIKDITNTVELAVVVSSADKTMTIDSTITLDRTKWDIRYGSGQFFKNLADNVIDDNFTVVFKMIANMQ